MAKKKDDKGKAPSPSAPLRVSVNSLRDKELHITIRYGMTVTGVVLLGWGICWAVTNVYFQPSLWTTIAQVAVLFGPGGFVVFWCKWAFKVYMEKIGTRLATIEKKVDPHRESSGVAADGTHITD